MLALLLLPLLLQVVAMLFDEFYFHQRRGLGKWESRGHPIDTAFVLITYSYLLTSSFTLSHVKVFALLVLASSLIVTKDEWVHNAECPATESWLHAVLFVLHPMSFFCAAIGWALHSGAMNPSVLMMTLEEVQLFWNAVIAQVIVGFVFLVYQITYWNLLGRRRNAITSQ
jgi:hypothetical protein